MIVTIVITAQYATRDECALLYEGLKNRLADIPDVDIRGTYSGSFELEAAHEVPD